MNAAHAAPGPEQDMLFPSDPDDAISALRIAGAHRFDPVRLCYLEVLAERAASQPDGVRLLLHARLRRALADFTKRYDLARRDAEQVAARASEQFPDAAATWQQLMADGDFVALRQAVKARQARESTSSLQALTNCLAERRGDRGTDVTRAGARPELQAIREFRAVWSKLSVDRQVSQALRLAPKNAGPINSHMLALRSLALMREISPDYLNRFMSYTETLLCLDQAAQDQAPKPKKRAPSRSAKK